MNSIKASHEVQMACDALGFQLPCSIPPFPKPFNISRPLNRDRQLHVFQKFLAVTSTIVFHLLKLELVGIEPSIWEIFIASQNWKGLGDLLVQPLTQDRNPYIILYKWLSSLFCGYSSDGFIALWCSFFFWSAGGIVVTIPVSSYTFCHLTLPLISMSANVQSIILKKQQH